MKHLQTYRNFATVNEMVVAVGPIKIDTTPAEQSVDAKVAEMSTPEIKKNFKATTGLDIDKPLREVAVFLKGQLAYINPVLFKKDLTQAEFDAMTSALIARVDTFIKAKAEALVAEMSFSAKSALAFIPETALKKKIQAQNREGDDGLIESLIDFLAYLPGKQTFYGADGQSDYGAVICSAPSLIKTNPADKAWSYDCTASKRVDLFYQWAYDNMWRGRGLVNHYIDLIVPILA